MTHDPHPDPAVSRLIRQAQERAWDEGFDAGERDVWEHQEHDDWDRPCIANPYREEAPDA